MHHDSKASTGNGGARSAEPSRAAAGDVRFFALRRDEVSDELIDRILALYARAFGRWPRLDPGVPPASYLRWKMESPGSPWGALVGWLGPRLVFARLVVRHDIQIGQTSRVMLDTPDLAVDPDLQGRGISIAGTVWSDGMTAPLSDLQVDDSTNQRVWKSRLRNDALPIANALRAHYLVLDPGRLPDELLRGGPRRPAFAVELLLRAWTAAHRLRETLRRRAPAVGSIRTATRFDAGADVFFEQAAAAFDLIYVPDRARLEWRYCDRRAGPFVVRILEEGSAMVGYAVHRPDLRTGSLVDLLTLPDREDAAEALIRDAVALLAAGGASAVSTWLPNRHPYRSVLRRAGFLTLPRPIPLRYRGQRLAARELAFLDHPNARLHFTMGSTDLF